MGPHGDLDAGPHREVNAGNTRVNVNVFQLNEGPQRVRNATLMRVRIAS